MNNNTLGPISSDANDPFPPTPASLLNLREDARPELEKFSEADLLSYGRKRWRRVQHSADQVLVNWKKDYWHGLQERRKWTKTKRNLRIGDVVLVKEVSSRNNYRMGILTESHAGTDGLVRFVHIRLKPASDADTKTMHRTIYDLMVLVPADAS